MEDQKKTTNGPGAPAGPKPKVGEPFNPSEYFKKGTWIPDELMYYEGISLETKVAWSRLRRYAYTGRAFPNMETFARDLNLSEKQARRHIIILEREKFIRPARHPGKANQYDFLWHPCFDLILPSTGGSHRRKKPSHEREVTLPSTGGSDSHRREGYPPIEGCGTGPKPFRNNGLCLPKQLSGAS